MSTAKEVLMSIAKYVMHGAVLLPCAALAVALFAAPAGAAAPTCKDLLVVAGRTYACTLVADEGSDVAITLSFSAPADGGPSFEAETNERITFTCACDSKGSAGQPAFFAARSFTCVTGDGPLVSVLRGRVSGRSAQAIKQMSGWGAGHGVVGACVLP